MHSFHLLSSPRLIVNNIANNMRIIHLALVATALAAIPGPNSDIDLQIDEVINAGSGGGSSSGGSSSGSSSRSSGSKGSTSGGTNSCGGGSGGAARAGGSSSSGGSGGSRSSGGRGSESGGGGGSKSGEAEDGDDDSHGVSGGSSSDGSGGGNGGNQAAASQPVALSRAAYTACDDLVCMTTTRSIEDLLPSKYGGAGSNGPSVVVAGSAAWLAGVITWCF